VHDTSRHVADKRQILFVILDVQQDMSAVHEHTVAEVKRTRLLRTCIKQTHQKGEQEVKFNFLNLLGWTVSTSALSSAEGAAVGAPVGACCYHSTNKTTNTSVSSKRAIQ
jgi:hypothetical protein